MPACQSLIQFGDTISIHALAEESKSFCLSHIQSGTHLSWAKLDARLQSQTGLHCRQFTRCLLRNAKVLLNAPCLVNVAHCFVNFGRNAPPALRCFPSFYLRIRIPSCPRVCRYCFRYQWKLPATDLQAAYISRSTTKYSAMRRIGQLAPRQPDPFSAGAEVRADFDSMLGEAASL